MARLLFIREECMGNIINRIFVSPKLMLGYFGVMIFMAGEGLELNWLPDYLQHNGMTEAQTGLIYTIYGLMVAISSWFSGVLAEIFGVRRVMFIGLVLFYIGSFFFLTFGIPTNSLYWIIPTYAIRGLAYPLFAYGFLVWVAYEAPAERLGSAVGIFWFMYSGGVAVIGTKYSDIMLNYFHMQHLHLLWTALIFVTLGAIIALALSGGDTASNNNQKSEKASFAYLLNGLTILTKKPKVAMGGIVRMINTSAAYGFPVFIPALLIAQSYDKSVWLSVVFWLWMTNVAFNLLWGIIADKLGWRNVVMWFGCVGCAITTFLFYYAIVSHASVLTITIIASVYGCFLAAFVPLSAIMPMLAPNEKGAAMSILNFGAGMSYFFGYFIVTLFIASIGSAGVIYIYTILYVVAAILMIFVNVKQPSGDSIEHELSVAVKEAL
ncbi:Nitrate/nitrite transporter NarK (NarK) (PDB:4JR9) [Commensalibacter communis]|nr:Nitrate/nitrite transporter NarK (NarK) (PDB:4JR9) [Commensalibacter communis]